MRILSVVCILFCLSLSSAESLIFSAKGMKEGQKLHALKTPVGEWAESKYPCRVRGGGISTNWKGHVSFFRYAASAGTWKLKFNVKIAVNAANEIILAQRSGSERQLGVIIKADGTLKLFGYRCSERPVPDFVIPKGKWTALQLEFTTGAKPAVSISSGGKVIYPKLYLDARIPQAADHLEIRASAAGDGGRNILLDEISLAFEPVAAPVSLSVKPLSNNTGFCFVAGEPVKFQLNAVNLQPDMDIVWKITPYYHPEKTVLSGTTRELTSLLPQLPKKSYKLFFSVLQKGKKKAEKSYSFAVLSPPAAPPADPEKEFIGMCTMEMHPSDPVFEKDLAILKLLGIRHIRIWSPWSWYHKNSGSTPELKEKVKAAERFQKEGIQWVEDIQAAPEWASDAPRDGVNRWKYPPADWQYYKEYIRQLTASLGNRADYQVWCEPASWMSIDRIEKKYPGGMPEVLAKYMTLTRDAVRENAPRATFMGPASSSGVPEWSAILLKKYGTLFDAISYHYPKWPNTPRSTNQRFLREILMYADRQLPQICDEAESLANADSPEQSLFFASQNAVEQWAEGICKRFYHCLFRHPRVPDGPKSNYLTRDFQAAGGIGVLQTLLAKTRDADYVGLHHFPAGTTAHFYLKNNRLSAVVWNNKEDVEAPFWHNLTRITDCYGNSVPPQNFRPGKSISFLEDLRFPGKISAQLRPYSMRLDDNLSLPVKFTVYAPEKLSGELRFDDHYAEIKPERISIDLARGERREFAVTIRPRPGRCDMRFRPVTATWNKQKIVIGSAQYFNPERLLRVDGANFRNPEVWELPAGEFDHNALSKLKENRSAAGFTVKKDAAGNVRGVFSAKLPPQPNKQWLGLFYPRKPLTLPGIPILMRFKYHATTDMLPSGVGIIFRFQDAAGKKFQYGVVPFIQPSDTGTFTLRESLLDSPMGQSHQHSYWDGRGDRIQYPITFLGFSINPTPQRKRSVPWQSTIEVETIEFDCYEPQDPTPFIYQKADWTNHF
ncbi:MAG: hypothetical protein J6C40_15095 [Lentisphaeria bacterium]|nr:hypothetical protein [Lentisphaeria bacterium]